MRCRFLKIGCLLAIFILAASSALAVESREQFEKEMQEIFAKEAVTSQKFNSAVQTARLLGLIEFMPDSSFPLFQRCLKQVRPWSSLAPKEREEILQKCKLSREPATTAEKQTNDNIKAIGDLEIQLHELSRKMGLLEATLAYKNDQIVESVNHVGRNLESIEKAILSLKEKIPQEYPTPQQQPPLEGAQGLPQGETPQPYPSQPPQVAPY